MNAQGSRTRGEEQGTGVRGQGTAFGRERTGQANPQSAICNPQSTRFPLSAFRLRPGFTLIEVLVAMALTLLMMGMVVTIFGYVSGAVTSSRSTMEMGDQMRSARQRLQSDLGGVTVKMLPPRRTIYDEGYFELIEGPAGRTLAVTKLVDEPYDDANKNGKWDGDANGDGDYTDPGDEPFVDLDGNGSRNQWYDTTVGDNDDILMFTTRSPDEPFVGRGEIESPPNVWTPGMLESPVAEVAWFLRGTTLYRRVLLVKPGNLPPNAATNYYGRFDVAAHMEGGNYDLRAIPDGAGNKRPETVVPSTLGDLTKREYRYAHQPYARPYDARDWGPLGLPTLQECSHTNWKLPKYTPPPPPAAPPMNSFSEIIVRPTNWPITLGANPFDAWDNPFPWTQVDPTTGMMTEYAGGARVGEDVVMTNVLSFDVKVWDPTAPVISVNADGEPKAADDASVAHVLMPGDAGYTPTLVTAWKGAGATVQNGTARGAYVDLNYLDEDPTGAVTSVFSHRGTSKSQLNAGGTSAAAVYDTGSFHYEHDGINQDAADDNLVDEGTNGFDDDGNGVVDDAGELEMPPPYTAPLRGIQIKIRAFEPDSRAIREMTIVQEFLPE